MSVTCRPDTFWALYETVLDCNEKSMAVYERLKLNDLNPDGANAPVTHAESVTRVALRRSSKISRA